MRGGAYENVSEAYRAEVSPERRVLQVYTLYCITLHNKFIRFIKYKIII